MIDSLKEYVTANKRVCPMPGKWHELWEMLPNKKRKSSGGWEPSLPLILAVWDEAPGLLKILRLKEHIEYADKHGVIDKIDTFLRSLPEEEWFHIGD
jgi:hypothetical protein